MHAPTEMDANAEASHEEPDNVKVIIYSYNVLLQVLMSFCVRLQRSTAAHDLINFSLSRGGKSENDVYKTLKERSGSYLLKEEGTQHDATTPQPP